MKEVRKMNNNELIDELIETSKLIGEWSMETYNPRSLNAKEEKRYDGIIIEILSRMCS